METLVHAYAKLNLSLDVLYKRPDGYHEMKMVMQSVALCDDISIACTDGDGEISVSTNRRYLPSGDLNSAGKAARLFMDIAGIRGKDVAISILKRIPVCAGMAGGSSDAAAVLRGMNELFKTGFDREALKKMGESLGSDVPYCVSGGTALACGRGEKLTDLPDIPDCHIVVCKPPFPVSTPTLFSRLNCSAIKQRPDTDGLISALENGDLTGVGRRMFNVFESVLPQGGNDVEHIKSELINHGALGASMSGTGPSVFGIFDDAASAESAYKSLSGEYRECFLTKSVKKFL
ncbi:MAG: 4-(cytidine 5'-diphospho)-2-C-methyl-D-erythritol kinase [Oscillospiraceae bacterium]|nr:4-(cytidine 5'-diphospho)-2-C-methyl-D-erythritol kinase [Oscillospiraceae bacterium]